jgi:hypothetical protein
MLEVSALYQGYDASLAWPFFGGTSMGRWEYVSFVKLEDCDSKRPLTVMRHGHELLWGRFYPWDCGMSASS